MRRGKRHRRQPNLHYIASAQASQRQASATLRRKSAFPYAMNLDYNITRQSYMHIVLRFEQLFT